MGKAAAGALKYRTVFKNLCDAVALQQLQRSFLPSVNRESLSVKRADGGGDARLETQQECSHLLGTDRLNSARWWRRIGQGLMAR